jgi:hypothetical protein
MSRVRLTPEPEYAPVQPEPERVPKELVYS